MSYAYNVPRPDHFQNIREAATENYRGLTAVVDNKLYLVIREADGGYILEDEDGKTHRTEYFDHSARNEHDALIAASRTIEPFKPGTKIGDWTIGNLAYHEGNWHVRNGDTDQIVPIEQLVQMLEDESYFKENFNRNFNVQLSAREKRIVREAALKKVSVTIETNLPTNGWHNGAVALAQELGLDGTITYPNGETVDVKDFKNFMLSMMNGMGNPGGMNGTPITVETDNPELFWEVWEDTARRGGGGGNRERTASYELPDTPGDHFLDTMEVVADRRDYEHWNEEADRMWWEEEGKHDDYQEPYDDYNDRADMHAEALAEAADEGYMAAEDGMAPDAITIPYNDYEAQVAYLDGFNQGRLDMGLDSLTQDERDMLLGEGRWTGYYSGWKKAELIQDIPYQQTGDEVVHAYEDGDVVLYDGTTTFDPNKSYAWLLGQKEFDKAKQVKELIDRSPPQELPPAVIPPEEAQRPQKKLPEEAPLDPTGGQPAPASGAPMQPGAEVPPMPQQPRSKVEFAPSKEARKDFTHSEQKALIDENLEGRARNYDKLNLKGTHYELEQESSFDDFLWQ